MRKMHFSCVVLFCIISSDAVIAAEWSAEPSISLSEEYNDNIRFTVSPHPGVWQSRLTPSLRLSSKNEASEISGSAQLNINRYAGDPQVEDRNDQIFSLLTRFQSERNTWAMNVAYKQDSTADERNTTGVVQNFTQRSAFSLSPSWTRALTDRSSLKLDYSYQEVKYATHITSNDYTSQQVGGALQYKLSERDQVSLSASYSKTDYAPVTKVGDPSPLFYLSTTTVNKSDLRNIQLGIDHEFSETLRGSLALGKRIVLTIQEQSRAVCLGLVCAPPVSAKSETQGPGTSFSANLGKTFEASKVSVFASRDTNASGSGLVETDKFGVSLNRTLTEKLTGSFDATVFRTKYIDATAPGSRYYTFEPKLNWHFMERWTLDAGYRYARFEPDSAAAATTANAVYLNLAYNWPKMAISR